MFSDLDDLDSIFTDLDSMRRGGILQMVDDTLISRRAISLQKLLLFICGLLSCLLYCTMAPAADLPAYRAAVEGSLNRNVSRALVARAALLLQGVDKAQLPASLTQPLDVVVSGGGFRGQYFGGVMSILGPLAESGHLKFVRWSGASIGAASAAAFAVKEPGRSSHEVFERFIRTPYGWQAGWSPWSFWRGTAVFREMASDMLPADVSSLNHTLHVTMSVLSWPRPWHFLLLWDRVDKSEFSSREDLVDTLCNSASIPGLTGVGSFGDKIAIDGGLTANAPVFTDGKRGQLLVNLGVLEYPGLYTLTPFDPQHDALVRQGQDDAIALLQSNVSGDWGAPLALLPANHELVSGNGTLANLKRRYTLEWKAVAGSMITSRLLAGIVTQIVAIFVHVVTTLVTNLKELFVEVFGDIFVIVL